MTEGLGDIERAVTDAVHETVKALGIEAVRALSWFPSNRDTWGGLSIEGIGG